MNPSEKEFIKSYKAELSECITVNTLLLTTLEAENVLSNDDSQNITSLKTNFDKSNRLLEILQTRTGGFQALIIALDTTKQSGAIAILQKLQQPREVLSTAYRNQSFESTSCPLLHQSRTITSVNREAALPLKFYSVLLPYRCLCLALGILVGALLTCFTFAFVFREVIFDTQRLDKGLVPNTTTPPIQLENNHNISKSSLDNYVVGWPDKYNKIVDSIENDSISIMIKILDPNDWPDDSFIKVSSAVKSLDFSGRANVTIISAIVNQTPNLEHMTLDNKDGELCRESKVLSRLYVRNNLVMSLKSFNLKYFDKSCHGILKVISEYWFPKQLESFLFENGVIENADAPCISHFLSKSTTTLKTIEFFNTLSNINIIGSLSPEVFPFVTTLVLDVEFRSAYFKDINRDHICSRFPNLEYFNYGKIFRKRNEISMMLKCNYLKALSYNIDMPEGVGNLNLTYLSLSFPHLEDINITLSHTVCLKANQGGNGNLIYVGKDLSRKNLKIKSKCSQIMIT